MVSRSLPLKEAEEVFGKAYDILVAHCGVRDTTMKSAFINAFTDMEWKHRTTEWRFQGCIGFGAKFMLGNDRIYIDCYPEERNETNDALINKVNKLLAELPFPGYPPYEDQ